MGEDAQRPAWLAVYENAVAAYREGRFASARAGFEKLAAARPDDRAVFLYNERLAALPETAPENWNPAYTMTEK
jgi:hypothetical protein